MSLHSTVDWRNRSLAIVQSTEDWSPESNIILNLSAVSALGFASPEDALGKTLFIDFAGGSNATVIGVVPDLPFTSLRAAVGPEAFINLPPVHSAMTISFQTENFAAFVASLENIWAEAGTTAPMDFS